MIKKYVCRLDKRGVGRVNTWHVMQLCCAHTKRIVSIASSSTVSLVSIFQFCPATSQPTPNAIHTYTKAAVFFRLNARWSLSHLL